MTTLPTQVAPPEADGGFTLLEVLVALAILSLSLGVLLAVFSQSLERAHRNQRAMQARLLAQALLEQSTAPGGLSLGKKNGQNPEGLRWTIDVKPYGTTDEQTAWFPVQVKVDVAWRDGDTVRDVEFETLRLLASPP
jgi:general secretion pathway protein I